MSFLTKLLGESISGSKAPTPAEAIQRLREVDEMLVKIQEFLERKVEQELQTVMKNRTIKKRVALQALRRKKRYEEQLTQIDGTLTTIEYQREALENANTDTEVLKIMEFAAKALKNVHEMDVDQVHDLMDEVKEPQEIADEISGTFSNPVVFDTDFDEDELLKELEEWEQEESDEQLIAEVDFPAVPTAEPSHPAKAKPVEEEENDMKEQATWAS